jgi:magnesium chelatase family protein
MVLFSLPMITLRSITLTGLIADCVLIEVDIQAGIPSCIIVGLGDTAVQESRERIRSAIKNSEYIFPAKRVTINLAPAHIRKTGSQYDLAIALGILLSSTPQHHINGAEYICIGELALNGEVRSVRGGVALILAAIRAWYEKIMVSIHDYSSVILLDTSLAKYLIPVSSLSEAYEIIVWEIPFNKISLKETRRWIIWLRHTPSSQASGIYDSIIGHEGPKRALMIAAAWGHNIILEWPPGSGKSLLARSLCEILPSLEQKECLEIAQIYSLRWEVNYLKLLANRPFRQIHKSASVVSIVGGGTLCLPGEMSLAHRGVIFFDELLEFNRHTLESLREPLEQWEIHISRAHGTVVYPARCMFVGATNPCPCWYLWDPEHPCQDSEIEITKYRSRLSGPIADRIDMRICVGRINLDDASSNSVRPKAVEVALQVNQARSRAIRLRGRSNAELSISETEALSIEDAARDILRVAIKRFGLSLRVYHRTLRVAQTIADLEDSQKINPEHILEALSFREI